MQESTLNSKLEKIALGSPASSVSGLASTVPSRAIFCIVEDVMETKTCTKCKLEKGVDEFCKNKRTQDGKNPRCRACVRLYRQSDIGKLTQQKYSQSEKYQSYQKRYRQSEHGKLVQRKYFQSEEGKLALSRGKQKYNQTEKGKMAQLRGSHKYSKTEKSKLTRKFYNNNHPQIISAHQATHRALYAGKLKYSPCEVCESSISIDAHHKDYSRPLEVVWLCRKHHVEFHNKPQIKEK